MNKIEISEQLLKEFPNLAVGETMLPFRRYAGICLNDGHECKPEISNTSSLQIESNQVVNIHTPFNTGGCQDCNRNK